MRSFIADRSFDGPVEHQSACRRVVIANFVDSSLAELIRSGPTFSGLHLQVDFKNNFSSHIEKYDFYVSENFYKAEDHIVSIVIARKQIMLLKLDQFIIFTVIRSIITNMKHANIQRSVSCIFAETTAEFVYTQFRFVFLKNP